MTPFDWDTPIAKPLACLLAVVLLLIVAGSAASCHYRTKAAQAEAQANVAKGEADAAKRQAQAKDAEISAKDDELAEARADVARKVAQLAKLRALPASANASAPSGASLSVDEPIHAGVVDLAPVVAKQDEVIKAQAVYIGKLEIKASDLTISRDAWKGSAEAREREAAGLRIALEAQKSLTKSALWRGRIQGLAFGIGSGYLAGRLHK